MARKRYFDTKSVLSVKRTLVIRYKEKYEELTPEEVQRLIELSTGKYSSWGNLSSDLWNQVKGILKDNKVPTTHWGLYRSLTLRLYSLKRKGAPEDQLTAEAEAFREKTGLPAEMVEKVVGIVKGYAPTKTG